MKLRNLLTGILAVIFVISSAMALTVAADYAHGNESYQNARALMSGSQQADPSVYTAQEHSAEGLSFRMAQEIRLAAAGHRTSFLQKKLVCTAERSREGFLPKAAYRPLESQVIFAHDAKALTGVVLDDLRAVNPQVIGWLFIPGTNIDYPIVQGADNQYYLEHTWDNQSSAVGSVFMEATNASDFSDYSTILYAHNLRAGTMFSGLHAYKDQAFWEENPYVYLVTDTGMFRYAIYAAYEADVGGTTYWRDVNSELRRQEYVDYGLAHSMLDTGITPTTDTPVLTLSTCTGYTYARRWVVQAVLEGPVAPPQQ